MTSTKGAIDTKLDPIIVHLKQRPQPVGEVKEVVLNGRKLKIGGDLSSDIEAQIYKSCKQIFLHSLG